MHNKTFTADGRVTIIGGRNIGDEYLGAGKQIQFVDLDVMAVGAVVAEVAQDFERYWSCHAAQPAETVLGTAGRRKAIPNGSTSGSQGTAEYLEAVAADPFVRELLEERLPLDWVDVRMVSDDPAKIDGRARKGQLLWARLTELTQPPVRELALVSAYFVPGKKGVSQFAEMARRGVAVTILTNSLAATDVAAVHAGYAKRRRPLLEAGVKLLELKRTGAPARPRTGRAGGSSDSSLHAKAFAIDRSVAFVGSFNFDPRSFRLNTEIAFVIESPSLAASVADAIGRELAGESYRVELGPDGALRWHDRDGDNEVVHDREPDAGLWRRFAARVLSVLPIEWLL
jgi:putative cardiolipin synthase